MSQIVLTPESPLPPGTVYYDVTQEYPNSPTLQQLARFILYPWAYAVRPITSWVQPPGGS
jgi:hypothetical protein